MISCSGTFGDNALMRSPRIEVQAKATAAELRAESESVKFSLPVKNYEDLRGITLVPRIRTFIYENNYGSIWNFTSLSGEEVEVILPEDQSLRDYKIRMIELFKTLEMVEERNVVAIVRDVSISGADVLRFRIASNEALTGTIPLIQAASLTRGVETALLAAACSTIAPNHTFRECPTMKLETI